MIEHPLPLAFLLVCAGWTAIRLLRGPETSAIRQAVAALVIAGALGVVIIVQRTDVIADEIEAPAAIVLGALIAAVALIVPLRNRRARGH